MLPNRLALLIVASGLLGTAADAEIWRSPLAKKAYVEIEKQIVSADYAPLTPGGGPEPEPGGDVLPIPEEITSLLTKGSVDYPEMVAAYVGPEHLAALEQALTGAGLAYWTGFDAGIDLPQWRIDPDDATTRVAPGFPAAFAVGPVPRRFVLQFAYPVRSEWLDALEGCGVKPLAALPGQAFLVDAPTSGTLTECSVAHYLRWIDSYLTTDRVTPEQLNEAGGDFVLQFAGGIDPRVKAGLLPGGLHVIQADEPEPGEPGFLQVAAEAGALASFAATDPDLIAVTFRGTVELSDECQGLIVAGRLTGDGKLTTPGYLPWLAGRGLTSAKNQQIVGIVDSGYDRGNGAVADQSLIDHHLDLEKPDRLTRQPRRT